MKPYAIMRCKKLKSMGNIAAALQHCYRERETPNADEQLTINNIHYAAKSTNQAIGHLRSLLPEKRRKDAILAVEYVMTTSPEWWKQTNRAQQEEFFQISRKWLEHKYGKDRIITLSIHYDEKTPHLSAFVVPLTKDGRLSAKELVGNKKQMTKDQTIFAWAVEHLGLQRGIQGSKAKHQTIKRHYGAIEQAQSNYPHISIDDIKPREFRGESFGKLGITPIYQESPKDIAKRLNEKIKQEVAPFIEMAAIASQERRRSREMRETITAKDTYIRKIDQLFLGLTDDQIHDVFTLIRKIKHENEIKKQQEQKRREEKEMALRKLRQAANREQILKNRQENQSSADEEEDNSPSL